MEKNRIHSWTRFVSSSKGAKIVLIVWLLIIVLLSGIAPSAKKFAVNSGEGSIHNDTPSAMAEQLLKEQFPSDDGLIALLVFSGQSAITEDELARINGISEWLSSDRKPAHISSALPFHQFPKTVQSKMFSEDQTTVLLNVALEKDLEADQMYDTLQQIRSYAEQSGLGALRLEITGPASIAADTIALFKNADLVLLFATIGLILVILIIIYRSPLLAVIPLIIAGMVYQVVDRALGLAAKNGWFVVDKQALSIMMILLFAVLTDYCLFVISRYREELKKIGSKYDAMKIALTQVAEPIMFSGGTVLVAVLTLFTTVFEPYRHFAPVFAVAIFIILLGGITLIPALFAIIGRKAFWPFVPKLEDEGMKPNGLWSRLGTFVTTKPARVAVVLLIMLAVSSVNVGTLKYSFNLMKSFPSDIPSRQGFEILNEKFPPGTLAPVSVALQSDKEIVLDAAFVSKLAALTDSLHAQGGISSITPEITPQLSDANKPLPRNFLSEQKRVVKLQLTLQDNPYDQSALDLISTLRGNEEKLLRDSDFDPLHYSLHYGGQTAEKLDVRVMNNRDTVIAFSLITIFIAIMLAFQARSLVMGMTMMATMLLSYMATLGISWFIFHQLFNYDAISYRLPMYVFVFLIALGVDYNIMLVSRIKEEASKYTWKEAVRRGVALTGEVISSAGIILAATFCVLMTQPLQELFLFGMTMAIGILMDTFLVRGMLLPSIMMFMGKRSLANQQPASTNIEI